MHEYSLVEALVARVEQEARARGAVKVHALTVRLGELAGVDAEPLQTAYETFRTGTICEGAPLVLRRVAARWSCPRCRRPMESGAILRCPECELPAQLEEGSDALTLDAIDLEVP